MVESVLIPIGGVGWMVLHWWLQVRRARRWEADPPDVLAGLPEATAADWAGRPRRYASAAGRSTIVLAVLVPPLGILAATGAPGWAFPAPVLAALLGGLWLANVVARRWPGTMVAELTWSMWPDELRTLRTPAGRVGAATAALALFAVAAALATA